jgi:hypothetical protein
MKTPPRQLDRELENHLARPGISPESAKRVHDYVDKYMGILRVPGDRPRVRVHDEPEARWLGRTAWDTAHPRESVLELQERLFQRGGKHLERVVAHEMIHHRNFLRLPEKKVAQIAAGAVPNEPAKHEASFDEGAQRINAIMGRGFVVREESAKNLPAYLLPRRNGMRLLLAIGVSGALALTFARRNKKPAAPARRENERGSYG